MTEISNLRLYPAAGDIPARYTHHEDLGSGVDFAHTWCEVMIPHTDWLLTFDGDTYQVHQPQPDDSLSITDRAFLTTQHAGFYPAVDGDWITTSDPAFDAFDPTQDPVGDPIFDVLAA